MRPSAPCHSNRNQGRISWFPLWLPLGPAKKACRDRQASSVTAHFTRYQSGRPDSNRRRPAWEAGILPTELRPRVSAQDSPLRQPLQGNAIEPARRYRFAAWPRADDDAVPREPFCREDTRVRQSRTSLMSCRTPRHSAMLNARS